MYQPKAGPNSGLRASSKLPAVRSATPVMQRIAQPSPQFGRNPNAANAGANTRLPGAPPVYRTISAAISPQTRLARPAAPPVYRPDRPQHMTPLQSKVTTPANFHPAAFGHSASLPAKAPLVKTPRPPLLRTSPAILRKVGFEYELGIETEKRNPSPDPAAPAWISHEKGDLIVARTGYNITADITEEGSRVEFILTEIDENDPVARQAIVNAAQQVRQDIIKIMQASENEWVLANQVPGLNGTNSHRFRSPESRKWHKVIGQLQMTGGVHISRLADMVSGRALDVSKPLNTGNYK